MTPHAHVRNIGEEYVFRWKKIIKMSTNVEKTLSNTERSGTPITNATGERRSSRPSRNTSGSGSSKSRTTSSNSARNEPFTRRPSALGERHEIRRSSSFLQRVGLRQQQGIPIRSPTGAMRHISGLTIRPLEKQAQIVPEDEQWHIMDIFELFSNLKSCEGGLTSEEANASLAKHGLNQITPPKQSSVLIKFLISLVSGFQLMMNVGAVLCFIVYGISEGTDVQTLALGIILILVVLITSFFQIYQEGKADKIMQELRNLTADQVWVYRDNNLIQIPSESLAVGDIVQVKSGEKVPADIRILTAIDLKVNNAALTGENIDIKLGSLPNHEQLYEAKNIARSGCSFTSGHGTAIVFATGDNTFFGKIAKSMIEVERPETLMKQEIERLIKALSVWAVFLGITFGALALGFGVHWIGAVTFAIAIIIANVPEGLLSQLVLTLSVTALKLRKHGVLVTNLEIIETLGAVSVICSDKTGTLTANRMTVSHVVYDGIIHTTTNTSNLESDTFPLVNEKDTEFIDLQRIIMLNTDAVFVQSNEEESDVLKRKVKGDASETALIRFIQPFRDIAHARQ